MPQNLLPAFIKRLESLETKVEQHLKDGVGVLTNIAELKTNIKWLMWLNMGIAALVLFKLVAEWIVK